MYPDSFEIYGIWLKTNFLTKIQILTEKSLKREIVRRLSKNALNYAELVSLDQK